MDREEAPVAKMTSSLVENLPEPVVIVKELDKDGKTGKDGKMGKDGKGKVTLNPKAKLDDYGEGESSLLKKYSN